ncbi:MAG: chemotaxis-specific protein-glutamate methyltransferase CheB [Lachnospiraceae bacterium]|nr:chemotaxis-specific protein-glutamate methyltransferase CheB [Lachnospiraceae bacterium]
MKKILVVDDSALMRRVFCDIINADERFKVVDEAFNGEVALELLLKNSYDAVILDVNMPKMDGIELLKELKRRNIRPRILMASTVTMDGAQVTLDALELGALDFIHKPDWAYRCRNEEFIREFMSLLDAVCRAKITDTTEKVNKETATSTQMIEKLVRISSKKISGKRIIALACSTGGPRALQSVIPNLPQDLNAPMVLVQHMPVGFTESLAYRLNGLSKIKVVEAAEGDALEKGCVYIAKSGQHMNLVQRGKDTVVHYTDEPTREGVRPCANYMYESLADSDFDEVVCVVMTGMGADGMEGIAHLKEKKKTFVITQDENSCVVYGMPKSVVKAGLSDETIPLPLIAQEIILHVGVK